MRLNRHDDAGWRAIARSCGVPEDIAAKLWLRVEEDAKYDPMKAERAFRRLLEQTIAINALTSALEVSENNPATPGKATRVIDISASSADAATTTANDADTSPVERLKLALIDAISQGERAIGSIAGANAQVLTEALRRLGQGNGKALWSIENGALAQVLQLADAMVTIVGQKGPANDDKADETTGEELPGSLRGELESKLGVDFGDLRVHTDDDAAEQARGHDAIAFAKGKNVYFAEGAYDPSSADGRALIAHEATHVAQQREGGSGSGVSAPGSAVELEADRVASAFAAGMSPGAREFAVAERASAGTISRKGADPAAPAGSPTIKSVTTATPASGAKENRWTVGVGEEVTFSATGGESGDWTASGGKETTGTGPSLVWHAPGTAGQFTIKLKTAKGEATKSIAVVVPTGVKFTIYKEYGPDRDNWMGAGMWLDMQLDPLNVSFNNVTIKEKPGGAHGLSGYFHGQSKLDHAPKAKPTQILESNKADTQDDARLMDTSEDSWPRPIQVGSMSWDIPHLYTAGDATDVPFAIAKQTMGIVNSKGTVTVTKGTASTSRTPKQPVEDPNPPKKTAGSTSGRHLDTLSGEHGGARVKGGGPDAAPAGSAPAAPTTWNLSLIGKTLDLSKHLPNAEDIGGGQKKIALKGVGVGALKLDHAIFKANAAGDKVESGTLAAMIDSGKFQGTTANLTVNSSAQVSGKLEVPINAPGLFLKSISVDVSPGTITGKATLDPNDFKGAKDFPIKLSKFVLTVTSTDGEIEVGLTGSATVSVQNGMASGEATMTVDLKATKDGVKFDATVKGKIAILGIAQADATMTYDGQKVTFNVGSSVDFDLPGVEGKADIKYELGKLSVESTNLRFTLPQLKPVAFDHVKAADSKLAATLHLGTPIDVPLPGGAKLTLQTSTIAIDGKAVSGDITGTFALNNAGGFGGEVKLAYAAGGGFGGSVSIHGGAKFSIAGVDVTISESTKLTIAKSETGLSVAGEIGATVSTPALTGAKIDAHIIAKSGEPIDLTVDTHFPLSMITGQLGGQAHVQYKRGGGANAFAVDASNIMVNAGPVKNQVIFSSLTAKLAGKEITGKLTANPGTKITVGKTKITVISGEVELLPGKILNGHLTARADNAAAGVEATVGWNNGKFDWAAEGDFELDPMTDHKLKGTVHAAAGSNGTGNFVANGPITFGDERLKDVAITALSGNKEENRYSATVSARGLFAKFTDKIPSVQVTPVEADVKVDYNNGKFDFATAISAGVKYPKDGPSQLEGFFHLAAANGSFAASITDIKITAGKFFKSEGGSIDPESGEVTIGTGSFKIDNIASGVIKQPTRVNVKTGDFHVDIDVSAHGALEGVKLNATLDKGKFTAKLLENTPDIKFGKFASAKFGADSSVEIDQTAGLTAHVIGLVDAKDFGDGTFNLNYVDKKLTGDALVHVKPFAMFGPIDAHFTIDEHRKISTVSPVVLELAPAYTETFAANATITVDHNTVGVTGRVTEIKKLGKISEAFKGAAISYDGMSRQVTMEALVEVDKVIPELAPGSNLTLAYKNKIISLEGVLKPKSYGPVAFTADSHLTAKWDSLSKHFSVNGEAHADVANLCTVDFTVDAGAGGGQPGVFTLKGHIDATKLKEKIKGVEFSTITADFKVQIGGGAQTDVEFGIHAGISGIPAAGVTDIQASVDGRYKSGAGISGKLAVQRAKLGEVIADGSVDVEGGKFAGGSLHLLADFPSLKIEGRGTILPGELGGLNTTADLTVTPGADTALAKFVQSGNIHVALANWKLTEATGTLNLVPPSFLPLIDPKIVVSYKVGEGISACLKTQFKAPMAKNGELGNFEAGYKKGTGLYAHIDFPLTLPGFEQATIAGDLNSEEIKLSASLKPKNATLIKEAKIEAGYKKAGGFYVQGTVVLHASDELELEVGLRYDGNGLSVVGLTPKEKNEDNADHEVAGFKQHINIPLLTVGVASLNLQFGMGVAAGYRMPKIKFKNPVIEGGLDALDSGQLPAISFGGSIAMGAYVALTLSVQIVGQIQLLIASCDAGIGAEICARLNLELGADVNGRFAPGQGALIQISPYVSASLDLIASLIATLHAEVCWFTIVDKKWTLASANLAHIELGKFAPFKDIGLQLGGPGGTKLVNGLALKEDAFQQIEEGVKKGGKDVADEEANKDAREKVKPVLDAFKAASHQFENLPEGWQNGMTVAPVNFNSMFPGVDNKAWDYYQDNADTAETVYPAGACKSPVEKLSKAVAIMARRNPFAAGMLILGWRRAQIAHMGVNPDTGVNVVQEREEVQAMIEAKYQADLLAAQQKQKEQDEEHARHVALQAQQFGKAEIDHAKLGQQQKAEAHAKTERGQTALKEVDKQLDVASVKAEKEGAKEKPSAVAKAPPPPPPPEVPLPKPLAKPAPIPVPPPVPLPPPAQVLPPVTLPALPTNPGVDMKAAAPIAPQKGKPEVQSPGAKEAPKGGSPNPTPGATSNATQSGGGGGSPMPGGSGGGGGKAGGGGVGGTSTVAPAVAAGPAGIVSQGSALDAKKAELSGKSAPGKAAPGGKPPAAPPAAAAGKPAGPAPAGTPASGSKAPGGGAPPAGDKAAAPGGKPGGGALDPTVQKVVDSGKADENQQKSTLSAQDKDFQAKVDAKSNAAKAETKKLDVAAEEAKKKKEEDAKKAAAAAAAASTPGADPAKPGDKPKGPIGQKVVLDILGEIHTQYMETTGVPMVASTPMQVSAKLDEIDGTISKAPSDIKNYASPRIATARAQATELASLGAKAAGGDATALTAVTPAQQTLAPALKNSWSWAKVAADPAVTGGSIEDPLLHPYYATFKARVATLSSAGHINVDVTQFAEATWTKICKGVKAANPAMTDPKAYSDFEKGWLDMKSPRFLQAISEFDHLGKEIAKAASTSLAKAQHFGFWSKDEGRALAEQISDVTLETSAVGALMDGLPTLDGKKAGWDPEIWGALSHAYASAIIPEVVKGKKINVCIGAGVPPGNIWEAVESVALTKGLERVGMSLEAVSTYYGAAAKSKANRKEVDHTKQAGGIKGCVFVGPRSGAIAAANAHFAKLTDAPAATPATATPPLPAAGATPMPVPTTATPALASGAKAPDGKTPDGKTPDPKAATAPTAAVAAPPAGVKTSDGKTPDPKAGAAAPTATAKTPDGKTPDGKDDKTPQPDAVTVPKSIVVPSVIKAKEASASLETDALKMTAPVEFNKGGDPLLVTQRVVETKHGTLDTANGTLTLAPALDAAVLKSATSVQELASLVAARFSVDKVKITKTGNTLHIVVGINPDAEAAWLEIKDFGDKYYIGEASKREPTLGAVNPGVGALEKPKMLGTKDKVSGFVVNTMTTAKEALPGMATRYTKPGAAWAKSKMESIAAQRTGVVIGVNGFNRLDSTADGEAMTAINAAAKGITPSGPAFTSFGFQWEPNWMDKATNQPISLENVRKAWKALPADAERDAKIKALEGTLATRQTNLPYGVIRSLIADTHGKAVAEQLKASGWVDPIHIVTQDSDGSVTDADGVGLLAAYEKVLSEMERHPLMTIGGYHFKGLDWSKAGSEHRKQLTELANEIDRVIRAYIEKVAPQVLYPTEPNMLVKAFDEKHKDGLYDRDIKNGFGPGATEGRNLRDSVLQGEAKAEAQAKPEDKRDPKHPAIVSAPSTSIATSPVPGPDLARIAELPQLIAAAPDATDEEKAAKAKLVTELADLKKEEEKSRERGLTVYPDKVDPANPTQAVIGQKQNYADPETTERETSKALGLPREKDPNDASQRTMSPMFAPQAGVAAAMGSNQTPEQRAAAVAKAKQDVELETQRLAEDKKLKDLGEQVKTAQKVALAVIDAMSGPELEPVWAKLRQIFDEIEKNKPKPPSGGPGGPSGGPKPPAPPPPPPPSPPPVIKKPPPPPPPVAAAPPQPKPAPPPPPPPPPPAPPPKQSAPPPASTSKQSASPTSGDPPASPVAAASPVPGQSPTPVKTEKPDPKADPKKPTEEKSKYGAGPPPAGWQSRVRGTTPSESVASDDPGHTYHVLDDDNVVATTEPVLLAPRSAVSQRAVETKPKSEQLIVAACQRFEITIGNHMAGVANGAVKGLMAQVHGYIKEKIKPYKDNAAKVEAELHKLGGTLSEQWAGRIPREENAINAVLKGEGSIREAITLFTNFVDKILKSDLAKGLPAGAMEKLLPEVKELPIDAAAREAKAVELYNARRKEAQAKVNSVTGTWKDNKLETKGHQNESRKPSHQPSLNATDSPIAGAEFGGDKEGVPHLDGRYPKPEKTEDGKDASREHDDWWLHEMTVEEFTKLGGVLSPREKKLFNEGVYRQALAARKASIKDEASLQKAIKEAEAEAKKYVPWAAGFMGYDLHWGDAHHVNAAFEKLSVPVGAGVSGTTARTMQSMGSVGIDPVTGLKICLGYLLPIQAHSFSEVRTAAVAMGVPGYAPARGSHNYNQTPLKGDVESMPGWAEFDRLYSPSAIGDVAAKK